MIKYLKQSEIDKNKWDSCIKESINGLVYASSWYLDIVAKNWEALVENDYERVFPLIHGKKKGIHYLYQPVFTQQLGVFSKKILTEDVVHDFIRAIPKKFKFAEISFNTLNKIPDGNYSIYNWRNYELDLINKYDNIYKGFSTNLKRNIKKASKSGISIVKNIKPDEVIRIFRENKGQEYKSMKDSDYLILKQLCYRGIYKGMIQTYGAFTARNELCAGIIFLKSLQKVIFLFSGLTEEGRDVGAMPFLINYFIETNSQHHITLDFEGSNNPNLARFYKSFGSKECSYPRLELNALHPFTNILIQLSKWFRGLL